MRSAKKRSYVIALLKDNDADVIMLQETNLAENSHIKIPGYRVFNQPGVRGLLTAIKTKIPAIPYNAPIPAGPEVETLSVEIHLADGPLQLHNVYRNCNPERGAILTPDTLLNNIQQHRAVLSGDLNLHHPLWGSTHGQARCGASNALADALEESNMVVLNTGEPTHVNGGRLDLTIVTSDIATKSTWTVSDQIASDHYATCTTINLAKIDPPPHRPRRCYHKADWGSFQRHLEEWYLEFEAPEDLDEMEKKIAEAINIAADLTIPLSKPPVDRKEHWFYGPRVQEMKRRVNQHIRLHQQQRSDISKARLREVEKHAHQVSHEAKVEKWLAWCETFDQRTGLGTMWKKLKIITGNFCQMPAHPEPKQHAEEIMRDFASRASTNQLPANTRTVLDNETERRQNAVEAAKHTPDPEMDRPFNMREFTIALKNSNTAPGADAITHQMIAEAGIGTHTAMLDLVNKSYRERRLPSTWKRADILPIPKPKQPGKYRPISLTSCSCKLAERMMLNRLKWKMGKGHPNIFGFKPGSGTTDAIATLLTKLTEQNQPSLVVFLDLEKAFELANSLAILDELAKQQITGNMLGWIEDFLTGRYARVTFSGERSEYIIMENGTPQGSVLSPTLFNALMLPVVTAHLPENTQIYSYADDLVLVATGNDANLHIQEALNTLETTIQTLGLKFAPDKTKAMAFKTADPRLDLTLTDMPIEWTDRFPYLGILMDKWLTFRPHTELIIDKIKKRKNLMRVMTSYKAGASSKVLNAFYCGTIRPIMDYAACALIIGDAKNLVKLDKVQNVALRQILGAPGWTKVATLQQEAALLPIPLRLKQMAAGFAIKTLTAPSQSLTKDKLQQAACNPDPNRPLTWAQTITAILTELAPAQEVALQTDEPATEPPAPWTDPPGTFVTELPDQGKKSVHQDTLKQQAMTRIERINRGKDLVVYTDGSVDPDTKRAGAGVVWTSNGLHPNDQGAPQETALRVIDGASSMQTELTAINAALVIAEQEGSQHIAIHTDSLSSIQALQNLWPTDNREIITTAQYRIKKIKDQGGTVTINWIPSHVGIPLNDMADAAAAAGRHLHRVSARPNRSKAQLKNDYAESARMTWKEDIRAMTPNSASLTWMQRATGNKPVVIPASAHRQAEVAIHRLRLGYRCKWEIGGAVEVICPECDHPTIQPLAHYLIECPTTSPFYGETAVLAHADYSAHAASRVRQACSNPGELASHVRQYPPPR